MDHGDAVPIAESLDERRYLLDVAYGMLGSPSAAERVVDGIHRRWSEAAGSPALPDPECAELAERVRGCLRTERARPTRAYEHDALARALREACVNGDAVLLVSLLSPDVTAFFDGGGKVRAPVRPVYGSRQVARSLLTLLARGPRTTLTNQSVSGRTGLVARYDDQVAAVVSLDIADHRVVLVWAVLNPDKLRPWNQRGAVRTDGCGQLPSDAT